MKDQATIQTKLKLSPRVRLILQEKKKQTGKTMSVLVEEAVEKQYSGILPESTEVTQDDLESIAKGWTPETMKKLNLKY